MKKSNRVQSCGWATAKQKQHFKQLIEAAEYSKLYHDEDYQKCLTRNIPKDYRVVKLKNGEYQIVINLYEPYKKTFDLNDFKNTTNGTLLCKICDTELGKHTNPNDHFNTRHKDSEYLRCRICGEEKYQNLQVSMTRHIQRLHLAEDHTFKCPLCNYYFWHETQLNTHTSKGKDASL